MPGKSLLFDHFLLPALESGIYGRFLEWVDPSEKTEFRVLFHHKNQSRWCENSANVFVAWDMLKGRTPTTEDYFTRSRQRFKAALQRCPKLEKVSPFLERHFEVYRILQAGERNPNAYPKNARISDIDNTEEYILPEILPPSSNTQTVLPVIQSVISLSPPVKIEHVTQEALVEKETSLCQEKFNSSNPNRVSNCVRQEIEGLNFATMEEICAHPNPFSKQATTICESGIQLKAVFEMPQATEKCVSQFQEDSSEPLPKKRPCYVPINFSSNSTVESGKSSLVTEKMEISFSELKTEHQSLPISKSLKSSDAGHQMPVIPITLSSALGVKSKPPDSAQSSETSVPLFGAKLYSLSFNPVSNQLEFSQATKSRTDNPQSTAHRSLVLVRGIHRMPAILIKPRIPQTQIVSQKLIFQTKKDGSSASALNNKTSES